ncbi:unnamed protein product [Staurois parvus]|uniref:Uncharacterized protein n=1 Tax=Staurois parvus TaxID=386267 RepID=A0ABN9CLM1_9NEOB|nr:unnamed protein product [Staurois parvus]
MAECGDRDSSNGRPYRDHDTLWTWLAAYEEADGDPWQIYGPGWQQQWEAVQGPDTLWTPGSSMGRRGYRGPADRLRDPGSMHMRGVGTRGP